MKTTPDLGRIALVEDDDSIRELLTANLKAAGFRTDSYFSAEQLERKGQIAQYDLLILDIMLPGNSGLQLAEKIARSETQVPVMFISALNNSAKIEQAYKSGAIDYLVKPFDLDILLAKVRNLLFYFTKKISDKLPARLGAADIDWNLMVITRDGKSENLSPREARTLVYFLENPNRIITRQELLEKIWNEKKQISSRNIDNYLVKFRKLFENNPADPQIFLTHPGKGYACRR